MDTPLIIQILAGLAFLFACFLTYMCTKTWRWFHVTMMFFVFIAAMVFAGFAAYALKTRAAWVKVTHELEVAVEKAQKQGEMVVHGDMSKLPPGYKGDYNRHADLPPNWADPTFANIKDGSDGMPINRLKPILHRAVIDRGRVWRGCQVTGAKETNTLAEIDLKTTPAVAAPDGSAVPNHLQVKDVVYAFKEFPDGVGRLLPREYLGEYQVTAATDSTVSLRSTQTLDAEQKAAAGDNTKTWALYEQMPIDDRELFRVAGDTVEERKKNLATILPLDTIADAATREAILNSYARDGLPATDADPAENQYLRVTFEKEYEVTVNTDAAGDPLNVRFFDSQGRAVAPNLQRDKDDKGVATVKFKNNEGAEFLKGAQVGAAATDTIESLIAAGIAKIDGVVYRRKLNDYATEFKLIGERQQAIVESVRLLEIELAAINKTIENANAGYAYRDEEKTKLTADQAKIEYERTKITAYAKKLEAEQAAMKAGLRVLYQSIVAARNEIATIQAKIKEEVDRRSSVTASR